jgi:hypothetical protein
MEPVSRYRVEFTCNNPPLALEDVITSVSKEFDLDVRDYRYVKLVEHPERDIVISPEGIPLHMLDNIQIQEL